MSRDVWLSARTASHRRWTKKGVGDSIKRKKANEQRGEKEIEERLSATLGTRVRITEHGVGSGIIAIEYYSQEELQRILDYIEGERETNNSEHSRNKGIAFSV